MSDTTPKTAPETLKYAYWALIAAAVCSVLSGLAYLASRTWLKEQLAKSATKSLNTARDNLAKATTASARSTAQKDIDKYTNALTPKSLSHDASSVMTTQMVAGVLVAVILVLLAIQIRRHRYGARWGVVGIWAFTTIFGFSSVGLGGLLMLASSAPVTLKIPAFVGSASLIAAVVMVNLPSSVGYLSQFRPNRRAATGQSAAGQPAPGLRGLFAPRPVPQPRDSKSSLPVKSESLPAKNDVAGPTSAKNNGQDTRAKSRTKSGDDTNATAAPPKSPTPKSTPTPKSSAATAKNRGKSRRS